MARNAQETYDVVIAGGSFVGLSLALCLNRSLGQSARIAVVDAAPIADDRQPPADARASAISAASQNLFEALGVWSDIADYAEPLRDIDITDTPLTNAVRTSFLHFDTDLPDGAPAAHIVENQGLRSALLRAVRSSADIVLLAPRKVTDHRVDGHAAEISFDDADAVRARLLVAADGRGSPIRGRAGIKTVGWRYPQVGIAATVSHERDHEGRAIQHFLPAGPLAMLPPQRQSIVSGMDRRGETRCGNHGRR